MWPSEKFSNPVFYIVYAGGFATGNYVGIYVEEKLAIGLCVLRIITRKDATDLIQFLKAAGYGVTVLDAQSSKGPVKVIFTVIRRHDIDDIDKIIQRYNPKAFYSIEDVRFVSEGVFPNLKLWYRRGYGRMFKPQRKGK